MKKLFSLCLCLLLLVGLLPTVHAAEEISVTINGEAVTFDQPPVLIDGRTLVPIRAVCEALGADVYWYADYGTVIIIKNDIKLMLEPSQDYISEILVESFDELLPLIDENITLEDNHPKMHGIFLDVPPQIINGRTLLPIRAVCEALGATVGWDEATQTVLITCAQELIDDKNRDTEFFDRFVAFSAEQEKEYYRFMRESFSDNDYTITMNVRGSFSSDAVRSQYASLLEYKLNKYGIARTRYDSMRTKVIRFFFGVDGAFDQEALTKALQIKPTLHFKDADGNLLLDTEDVAGAELGYQMLNDHYEPVITLTFTEAGRAKFAQATERVATLAASGKNYIGIYFDDVCISLPYVTEKIDAEACVISGNFTDDSVYQLVAALNLQNFPNDISFEFEIETNTKE